MPSPFAIPDSLADDRPHHDDASEPLLPGFFKDRWRVFNCSAFRRLRKTQVFVVDTGDHYRTRLTHTLEVAQVARLLASQLGLNDRLAEVMATVHDLGHPPFGHAGEAALHELMQSDGGFDHNMQALRVIDLLEHPYRSFYGLNLANVIRWSHLLHSGPPAEDARGDLPGDWHEQPLEGQIVSQADRIAYDVHDVEDAIGADLVTERDLQEITLWRQAADPVRRAWPEAPLPAVRRQILDNLAFLLMQDLADQTRQNLHGFSDASWEAFCRAESSVVCFSPDMEALLQQHETFLHERAYKHSRVAAMDEKARVVIRSLFETYAAEPGLLPPRYLRRIEQHGLHRVICDYLAGMTDRFCLDTYSALFDHTGDAEDLQHGYPNKPRSADRQ